MSVPRLRFPEFKDAGEWDNETLEQLVTLVTAHKKLQTSSYKLTGKFPVIDQSQSYICGWTDDIDAVILINSPLVIFGDHTCALKLVKFPFVQGADGIKIIQTKASIDPIFLFQSLSNNPLQMEEYKRHYSILKERKIFFPKDTLEQQKIANCLSSLDDLIADHNQKLAALKTHKKGLMHQLFPAEGETIPKLRFPESRGKGEWKTVTIGDIADLSSGGTPSRTNSQYWNGSIPWVTTSLINFCIIEKANEFISELGLKESSAKIFPKGTILMAMYGQGITRGKVAILAINAATNQACAAILLKASINTDFLFQNLAYRYDEIRNLSNSGGQENLSAGLIEGIRISHPPLNDEGTQEQQRVADCLSSLDDLIIAQDQKINILKLHKKGLMQQLFPSADEVQK